MPTKTKPEHDPVVLEAFKKRFMAKIEKRPSGCWLWTAASRNGYGYIGLNRDGWRPVRAHRVAYELFVQPIPQGLVIHHRCGIRLCVNPDHLELLDHRTHTVDRHGAIFKAQAASADAKRRRTTCRYGHPYTPESTYITRTGRRCRVCAREQREARKRAN